MKPYEIEVTLKFNASFSQEEFDKLFNSFKSNESFEKGAFIDFLKNNIDKLYVPKFSVSPILDTTLYKITKQVN